MQETQLYIVPTPIGNMEDMTFRAVKVLKEVDLILAEDTRQSHKLLKHYEIQTPLQSYHQHNEHNVLESILEKMNQNLTLALVSDAGTPSISDPGFLLVRACVQNNILIECLPGATAFVPALVKSGLPSDKFVFEGFLPHKKGRKTRLEFLVEETRTMIFYESPYRLLKTLEQFIEYFGKERGVSVSRELTKMYEETINSSLEDVYQHFQKNIIKGEFIVILEGKKNSTKSKRN